MLANIDLAARRIRDRIYCRISRKSGPDLVNAVLTEAGKPPIANETYTKWFAELAGDSDMTKHYVNVRHLLTIDSVKTHAATWAERVARTPHLVDMFYIIPRAFGPNRIVETGVSFGHTTSLVLTAIKHTGVGHLVSIDLPAHKAMEGHISGEHIGVMVPEAFKSKWKLLQADARTELIEQLKTPTDMFIHDSDHSYQHMMLEYALASAFLPPNAVLISDDTRMNAAFHDFMPAVGSKVFPHSKNDSVACAVLQGS